MLLPDAPCWTSSEVSAAARAMAAIVLWGQGLHDCAAAVAAGAP
jgi:hypothetical protein